jgi:hypothetical protein
VLQRILGHTDIKMTMRYAHFAPDHLEDAVKLNPITVLKNGGKMAAEFTSDPQSTLAIPKHLTEITTTY